MTAHIRFEHRWVAGLAFSFILAAAPFQAFAQKSRSEVAPIAIPHGGKTGGAAGQKEARQALEKSVKDRKQGEKIIKTESIVWKSDERPEDSAIRRSLATALKKQGYSYEVLFDGTTENKNGQGAIYFQATPEEEGNTIVGMWLGFSDDEYKLVWSSLKSGDSNEEETEGGEAGGEEASEDGNSELVEALYKKGLKALADDRSEDAAKAFKQVLKLEPEHKGAAKALQALKTSDKDGSSASGQESKASADRKETEKPAEAAKAETTEQGAETGTKETTAVSPAQDTASTSATASSADQGKEKAGADALRRLFGK